MKLLQMMTILMLSLFLFVGCADNDTNSNDNATSTNTEILPDNTTGENDNTTGATDNTTEVNDNITETNDNETSSALEIIGNYTDNFQGAHGITETAWQQGSSVFTVLEYDNEANYLIAQNSDNNTFNPGKYSRFDWAYDDSRNLYYCQIAFDKETADEAKAATEANATALTTDGCNGFSWSQLMAL